jgi:hypothetical protein
MLSAYGLSGLRPMSLLTAIESAVLSMALLSGGMVSAQMKQPQLGAQVPSLSVGSNLVLVPALVKTRSGEVVFSLTADDFVLTDNGVPQRLQLEVDTDSQPLALAVIVQTGGRGAGHLDDYRGLDAVLALWTIASRWSLSIAALVCNRTSPPIPM